MKTLSLLTILLCSTIALFGQCREGDCINGEGTMYYSSGNKYQGSFKDSKRHGDGRFIWTSGAKYKGQWVNGVRQGQGIELLADGTRYEGEWADHKKNGAGILYDTDGSVLYQGQWIDNSYVVAEEEQSLATVAVEQTPSKPSPQRKSTSLSFDRFVNIGVGTGGYYANSTLPPLSVSFELKKLESGVILGAYLGYVGQRDIIGNFRGEDYGYSINNYVLGARAMYPVNLFDSDKTFTYVGGMLGYSFVSSSFFGDSAFSSSYSGTGAVFIGGVAGIRQELSEKLHIFGEAGYGISYFTVGISKRF